VGGGERERGGEEERRKNKRERLTVGTIFYELGGGFLFAAAVPSEVHVVRAARQAMKTSLAQTSGLPPGGLFVGGRRRSCSVGMGVVVRTLGPSLRERIG